MTLKSSNWTRTAALDPSYPMNPRLSAHEGTLETSRPLVVMMKQSLEFVKLVTFARHLPNPPNKPFPNKPTPNRTFIDLSDDTPSDCLIADQPNQSLIRCTRMKLSSLIPSPHPVLLLDVDLEEPVVLEASGYVLRPPPTHIATSVSSVCLTSPPLSTQLSGCIELTRQRIRRESKPQGQGKRK